MLKIGNRYVYFSLLLFKDDETCLGQKIWCHCHLNILALVQQFFQDDYVVIILIRFYEVPCAGWTQNIKLLLILS